jgi:hypothetical protein
VHRRRASRNVEKGIVESNEPAQNGENLFFVVLVLLN